MAKDERFSFLLLLITAAAFGAGVLIFGAYEGKVSYQLISFENCTSVVQIASVYLFAYLRTVFLVFFAFIGGYTPYSAPVCCFVMAARAFPCGIAAGYIYRADDLPFYACFLLFSGSVIFCYLAACRISREFACAAVTQSLLCGSRHRRQYIVRQLQICFFLALLCALWCCGVMTGVLSFCPPK